MSRIELGNQYEEARSRLTVKTVGDSKLEVKSGDLHDRSHQEVLIVDKGASKISELEAQSARIGETQNSPATSPPPPLASSGRDIWARGTFFLLIAILIPVTYAVIARHLSFVALPLVMVTGVVVIYLIALTTVPKSSAPSGFGRVLVEFMRLVFPANPAAKKAASRKKN